MEIIKIPHMQNSYSIEFLAGINKKSLAASVFSFISLLLFCGNVFAANKTFKIYYTGNGFGEIEPCGCSEKASYGGLKRRGAFLKENAGNERSGSLVIETGNFSPEIIDEQGKMKLDLLMKSMSFLGYDVLVASEAEKKAGDFFVDKLKSYNFSVISSAIDSFPVSISKKKKDIDIYIYTDIEKATIEELKKKGLHILLVNSEGFNIMDFPEKGKFMDLVINGSEIYSPALMEENTLMAYIKEKDGQTIGTLEITLNENSDIIDFLEIQTLLTSDFADDGQIAPLFDDYNQEVAELFKSKSAAASSEPGIYLGDQECKICHESFWKQWEKTDHFQAWKKLAAKGKNSDPDCIKCHSVGFGLKGGFISEEKTPLLKGVQCESCHGPGGVHKKDYSRRLPPVTQDTCLRCHNKKNSPDFNLETYYSRITH